MYLTVQLTALQAFNLCSEGIQIDDNLLQFPIIYLTNISFYIYNVHVHLKIRKNFLRIFVKIS